MESIVLEPIGFVESKILSREDLRGAWREITSKIIVQPELEETLEGLLECSHLFVFFWLDHVNALGRQLKKASYHLEGEAIERGVLATRVMFRPNPIGLTLVELVSVKGNVIEVRGLDAFNRTPVLDIKPYTGCPRDGADSPRVPEWVSLPCVDEGLEDLMTKKS